MLTRRHLLASAGAAAAYAASPQADAQSTYASQPVHILVGYPAGGGVDIIARLLQDPMKAVLGQPIIVENRTGASAMLATGAVAKAAPDGYTLLACASGEVAINHFLFKEKMAYDPAKELAPISLVGIVPCVVVVASTTPVSNPKELIAYIKGNPEKLSFSSSGIGNSQQLAGELMNTMAVARTLSRRRAGGHGRCNRRRHDEFHESGRGAAINAGWQDKSCRRHLARTDSATAKCVAAERGSARPCGLRVA